MRLHDHQAYGRHVVMTQAEWDEQKRYDARGVGLTVIDHSYDEDVRETIARFTDIRVYVDTCPCEETL